MEYEAIKPGYVLTSNYHFFNEEGVYVFVAPDRGLLRHRKLRPTGKYGSIAWIPGNFLSGGARIVGAAAGTHYPLAIHSYERDTVAFQGIDGGGGDSAREDYAGCMSGVVKPLLRWGALFSPKEERSPLSAGKEASS